MAQPVWTLSVDLQTKTATFTSGLADAAKGARGSFNDIKQDAQTMGRSVNGSMTEARHGVMLLGEEFGIHLPRALTSFIASIGPVGAAMEAAFPFLAILVGATLLIEHLVKMREEGTKLTESQINFGTSVNNVYSALNEKLLQAGIRADELNGNHLGALNKQLELIDHQSMSELVQSFGLVSKAADVTFEQLKTSWYQWGAGSAGAKSALEQFKAQYDSLIAQNKGDAANDLLAGTKKSAERVLELQKQAHDNQFQSGVKGQHTDAGKFEQAKIELQKLGIGFTQKEVEAQEMLVGALEAQANVVQKVNDLKAQEKKNATGTAQKGMDADSDKVFRAQAEEQRKADEDAERTRKQAYDLAVANIQENEKLKIDATKEGTAARLAAIDAAVKDENSKGLQETGFYKALLTSRVATARQMAEEQAKVTAESGKIEAEHTQKMGELEIAAEREKGQLMLSSMRNSEQARISEELQLANKEFAIKSTANAQEIASLDKSDKDYENKLKTLNNKQLELAQQHENQLTAIKDKAEMDRNSRILSADKRFQDTIASGMASTLMGHQTFAKMMVGIGDQIATGMIENAIKSILADDMTKEHDAAAAARKMFLAGTHFPFPANIIMAPALGAMAFASVMAFESGGIVPGVGRGDTVPAMLEPGEGVLNNKQMDAMSYRAKFGGDGKKQEVHIHHSPTYHVQAIDRAGVHEMLSNHTDEFTQHFHNAVRKMNR